MSKPQVDQLRDFVPASRSTARWSWSRRRLQAEIAPLRRIWSSITSWGVELAWWQARFVEGAVPVAVPAEVESWHWCTPEEMALLSNLLESNRQFLEALERGEIALD